MLHFLAMNIENDIVIVKTGAAIVKHCHDTNLDKSNIPKISLICSHYWSALGSGGGAEIGGVEVTWHYVCRV